MFHSMKEKGNMKTPDVYGVGFRCLDASGYEWRIHKNVEHRNAVDRIFVKSDGSHGPNPLGTIP